MQHRQSGRAPLGAVPALHRAIPHRGLSARHALQMRDQRVAILRRRFPTTVAGALRVLRRGVESAPVVQGSAAEAPLPSAVARRGGPRASHPPSPGARPGRLPRLPRPLSGQQRARLTQASPLPGAPRVHVPVAGVHPRLRLRLL